MPSAAPEAFQHVDGQQQRPNHGGSTMITHPKKRRWDDASSHHDNVVAILVHNYDGSGSDHGHDHTMHGNDTTTSSSNSNNHTPFTSNRRILPIKRQRLDDGRPQKTAQTTTSTTPSSTCLLPCHICRRAPRRKCDIDSLADCEGCGQRTCFVCLRECMGWAPGVEDEDGDEKRTTTTSTTGTGTSTAATTPTDKDMSTTHARSFSMADSQSGHDSSKHSYSHTHSPSARHKPHRRMICSQCCVERGPDGDVVCLGCLPYVEG